MRLRGRAIRFYYPVLAWSRGPRFLSRTTSLDLQQAAIMVEGDVAKVRFMGLERLYYHPMGEWTTITIPYSRISRVDYSRLAPLRILSWAVLGGLFLVAVASKTWLLLPVVAVLLSLAHLAFPSKCVIVFEAGEGAYSRIIFRVRSKSVRNEFRVKLEAFRRESDRRAGE